MLNYTTDTMGNSHFIKWMPLMGIYIAAATLVFAVAIIADLVMGLWNKEYWIPSEYVSLNSISLTILGAATKLSMDLSTAMPRHTDQLAKLGTSAFMCIALASIFPSLGKLENNELRSNTVALFFLVIFSMISLCIQLTTGVIYTFKAAHIIVLTMMTLLLLQCILTALFLPVFKSLFQDEYLNLLAQEKPNLKDDEANQHLRTKELEKYLRKFSVMAQSGCPNFFLGGTFLGSLPTIYAVVVAIAFFSTQITSITRGDKFVVSTYRSNISAYNWSVLWIVMSQTVALAAGSIVLCIRWCYYTMAYSKGVDSPSWKNATKSEQFWMKMDARAVSIRSFAYFIDYSQHKSLVYKLMIPCYYLCYYFCLILGFLCHRTIFTCKFFYRCIMYFCFLGTRVCIPRKPPHSPSPTARQDDLSGLYITGTQNEKEGSVKWIMKSMTCTTEKYMSVKERKTKHLEELLTQHLSSDFRGVVSFDSVEVPSLVASQESPPNCWSLPVVTLTHIAIALPNIDRCSVDKLIQGVNEGLVFAKLIEDKFNDQLRLYNVRWAAYDKWGGGYGQWFRGSAHTDKRPIEILKSLATSAESEFREYAERATTQEGNHAGRATTQLGNQSLYWACKSTMNMFESGRAMAQAADHSLYRLCKTILLEHGNENQDDEVSVLEDQRIENIEPTQLFDKLRDTIADILGACLTNLSHYILMECSNSLSIEKRREAAYSILKLFGDTKRIMEIVEAKEIPDMSPEKRVFIDEWRNYYSSRGSAED